VDVAQSALDVEARYLEPAVVEVARSTCTASGSTWRPPLAMRAGWAARSPTREWLRDRPLDACDAEGLARLGWDLDLLRSAADSGNVGSVANQTVRLAADVRNRAGT
jgi:hypothetical protein